MARVRGRFAPSPTGALHLGGLATALFAWASAKKQGGAVVLRVEDLDRARVVRGSLDEQLADLAWAGLSFDEAVVIQSERIGLYEAAIRSLDARGHVYACDCSRADLRAADASIGAPHAGEEGRRYAETCRAAPKGRAFKRPPAVRVAIPDGRTRFMDGVRGEQTEDVRAITGDFVLRRGDGVFAYQLAVTVDDALMGITEVVRGSDLAPSAARQVCLMNLLDFPRNNDAPCPTYLHVPLVTGEGGAKLSKRDGGFAVASYRERGITPQRLVAAIARAYGQDVSDHDPLASLAESFDAARFPAHDVPLGRIGIKLPGLTG